MAKWIVSRFYSPNAKSLGSSQGLEIEDGFSSCRLMNQLGILFMKNITFRITEVFFECVKIRISLKRKGFDYVLKQRSSYEHESGILAGFRELHKNMCCSFVEQPQKTPLRLYRFSYFPLGLRERIRLLTQLANALFRQVVTPMWQAVFSDSRKVWQMVAIAVCIKPVQKSTVFTGRSRNWTVSAVWTLTPFKIERFTVVLHTVTVCCCGANAICEWKTCLLHLWQNHLILVC